MIPVETDRAVAFEWLVRASGAWLRRESLGSPAETAAWPHIAKLALLHQLEPLLHSMVAADQLEAGCVPANLRSCWEESYFKNYTFNAELLDLLGGMLAATAVNGLEVAVFKGPVTIARGYGDPALRMMADVDLLCHNSDLPALAALARDLGFRTCEQTAAFHAGFVHTSLPVGLELHFDLYDFLADRKTLLASVWQGLGPVKVEGLSLPAPSLEVSTILDLAHLVQHDFRLPLRCLLDLAAVISKHADSFDRARLTHLLSTHHLSGEMHSVLTVLRDDFHWPVETIEETTSESARRGLPPEAHELLLYPEKLAVQPALEGPHRKAGMLATARYVRRRLFPSLGHLKALSGRSSNAAALRALPSHIATTIRRAVRRWRLGGLRDR